MKVSEQAFTKLVHEHKRTIYSVCYMFSADEEEVADLFQEVLIRMWKGLATFEERSQMRTWIYRLSLNVGRPEPQAEQRTARRRSAHSRVDGEASGMS